MHPSSAVLPQLADILSREESACELLLATLREERSAIQRLAVSEFTSINERRLGILASLETLDTERQRFAGQVSASWGLPPAAVTLQTILEQMKSASVPGLDERYARLAERLRAIREEIALNSTLIDNIRQFIEQMMSAWTSSANSEGLYSPSGGRHSAIYEGSFLQQRG
ncbi:protein of unknown function, FlgN-like domain [Nitrospira sp. KM1]|uniref:flagellar protein FlgN n=1 Tax=Nitrospira sp. KM1 TaxID=1936990 RepID=UPI0013A74162|nr:flagellar protein FlgN [Nitrospira sp. KM1]BCA54789.1 protein of unknown function, FlgN-like domain [Nitrospira sp. KM1]